MTSIAGSLRPACPFQVPAYEYDNAFTPQLRKCTLCYPARLSQGLMVRPSDQKVIVTMNAAGRAVSHHGRLLRFSHTVIVSSVRAASS